MNLKKLAESIIDDISGKEKKIPVKDDIRTIVESLENVELDFTPIKKENDLVENFDLSELDIVEKKEDIKVVNETTTLDFIGSFNYIPNPLEQPKNALYRNTNEGKVYIKNSENLWESFLSDGKQGAQGAKGGAGGGVGVKEAEKIATAIATTIVTSAVQSLSGTSGTTSGSGFTSAYQALSAVLLSSNDITITSGGAPLGLPNSLIEAVANVNSYTQIGIQNQSSGTSASSDIVATSDAGTDTNNFIDLGINGSTYSVPSWSVNGANDGYLYTVGGNLSIGTGTSGKNINLFIGGTTSANNVATITSSGISATTLNAVTISAINISASNNISATNVSGNLKPSTTVNFTSGSGVNGSFYLPTTSLTSAVDGAVYRLSNGDFAKSVRGQPVIDGGILYEKNLAYLFPATTPISATGLTIIDAGGGTSYARGGLKNTIKSNFWDPFVKIKGEIIASVDLSSTATNKFYLELLVPGHVIARGVVDPSMIPNAPTSAGARTVVMNFDLVADGVSTGMSAMSMRSNSMTTFGGGNISGTGTSAANLSYSFTNEVTTSIDWTQDQAISLRVNNFTPGVTIRPYTFKLWM